jgi:hypothetical protein
MRVAKETLNLELKRSWGRCQTCWEEGSDLEQQLSEIENKLVASSEEIELLKECIQQKAVVFSRKEECSLK